MNSAQPRLTWKLNDGLLISGWFVGMTMGDFSELGSLEWEFSSPMWVALFHELGTGLNEWKKVS